MSSKFIIDSMLPKYHQQYHHQLLNPVITSSNAGNLDSPVVNYSLTNNSSSSSSSPPPSLVSPASRMYPYVAASAAAAHHHHQQQAAAAAAFATGSMVPGAFTSPSSAALAAVVDAATGDKSCRYTSNVPSADSMVNYTLHHQNGATANSASAASASMAAFYHQAAAASVGADPLNSCSSQVNAGTGQGMPDLPRYPWMSITGKCRTPNAGSIVLAFFCCIVADEILQRLMADWSGEVDTSILM